VKNRNIWMIAGLVAVIALVTLLGSVFSRMNHMPDADAPSLTDDNSPITVTPRLDNSAPDATAESAGENAPSPTSLIGDDVEVKAYLVATVGNITYQPIPLREEGDYRITQRETGAENVIHVTANSVTMASATCDNQDCVKQGTVTLENKKTRVLGNFIICLPNQVTLQLCTPEELQSLLPLN